VGAALAAPALLVRRLSRHRRDGLRTHPASVKAVGRELT
jgi:hypothetical protein